MNPSSPGLPSLPGIWLLLQHRRPELAEAAARQRLAADPTEWQTLVVLSEALRQQDRLDEAGGAAVAAVHAAPDTNETHYALAKVRGRQGRLREADIAIREALRLDPAYPAYYGYRAQLFHVQGSYHAAIACAEQGLHIDPEQADCLLWRALAKEQQDAPTAADEDFRRLLRVAPESDLVHARLGRVLLNRYEPAAADHHLTEALRQAPDRAGELLPLLRRARREQHWPAWFLRSEQRGAQNRALGLDPGIMMLINRIRATGAVARAWWRTRRDPLFRQPLPPNPETQGRWRLRLKIWAILLAGVAALAGISALCVWLGFPSLTGIMPGIVALLIAQYLREKRDNTG